MQHSFIVRQEHIDRYGIDQRIREHLPEANIFSVEQTTRGAVETCLKAESALKSDEGVVVLDCDLEFRSLQYADFVKEKLSHGKGLAFVLSMITYLCILDYRRRYSRSENCKDYKLARLSTIIKLINNERRNLHFRSLIS